MKPKPENDSQTEDDSGLYAPACSPSDVVALVRRYNRWRKGEHTLEMEHPKRIGEALDAICDITETLERHNNTMTQKSIRLEEALQRIASGLYTWRQCVDEIAPQAIADSILENVKGHAPLTEGECGKHYKDVQS